MKESMSWLERLALPVEKLVGGMVPGLPVSGGINSWRDWCLDWQAAQQRCG